MIFYDKRKEQYEVLYLKDSHFDVLQIIYGKKMQCKNANFSTYHGLICVQFVGSMLKWRYACIRNWPMNLTYSYYTVKH